MRAEAEYAQMDVFAKMVGKCLCERICCCRELLGNYVVVANSWEDEQSRATSLSEPAQALERTTRTIEPALDSVFESTHLYTDPSMRRLFLNTFLDYVKHQGRHGQQTWRQKNVIAECSVSDG